MSAVDLDGLAYHVVDVFTDTAYAGNPLAVVLDADGLSTPQMQQMAREFNLSETTFVLPTTSVDATYRVRIFTPGVELPFAGHPSVGTAWLLARLGRIPSGEVVQECGAGLLPVVVTDSGATLSGGAVSQSAPEDAALLAAALGLAADDLVGTPVRWCGCGIDFGYLHVRDEALARCAPDLVRLAAIGPPGNAGVSVFSVDGDSVPARVHARVFAGGAGVAEDPATGSAALGLGVFLVASGLLAGAGSSTFTVEQGLEMGRPSTLNVTVSAHDERVVSAQVTGGVVPVATGRITPPPSPTSAGSRP
jgi:trans-2,3-dihydro-3-hydroxyanthranilate isomerase